MNEDSCTVEISIDGTWMTLGRVYLEGPAALGISAGTRFEYDDDFAFDALQATNYRAASCRYPVILGSYSEPGWLPFLLDLIPSGAGRRFWEARLNLANARTSDWELLLKGALNPPGNLRVAEATQGWGPIDHDGFSREDVILKSDEFLAYAQHNGVSIIGSSGANGDAPKMLLTERLDGRWQPSGTAHPASAKAGWIAKFPRGRDERDRAILYAEKSYYDVARDLGLKTGASLYWEGDCLFIPRFDVSFQDGKAIRSGLESLASVAGIADFGVPVNHGRLVETIRRHSSDASADVAEYLARDVVNVAMGNTDNHARNTSLLKTPDGKVMLAPLYDFAPMMVDPSLIPRVIKWSPPMETSGSLDWKAIITHCAASGHERDQFVDRLKVIGKRLTDVAAKLESDNVSDLIVSRVANRCSVTSKALSGI